MKSDPYHTPFTKINLKWIKNVNARPAMLKFLGRKIGKILILVSVMIILVETPKAQATQVKVNKWVYIKLKGPPSMGFSREEYWSGVPLPSPI